jgi:hypothetical protein
MLPDEKHTRMAFEIYDFNKDKFICNSDTFYGIKIDTNRLFSTDFIKIQKLFDEKAHNISEVKEQVNKPVNILYKFKHIKEERKSRALYHPPGKPESLNFEEFSRIVFEFNKPKIIIDILEYLTGSQISDQSANNSAKTRENSEEIAEKMMKNSEFRDKMSKTNNFDYYIQLFNSLRFFHPDHRKIILDKFKEMQCPSYYDRKLLSLNSISKAWPNIFGIDSKFINESFYMTLTGHDRRDITKLSFINKIKEIFDVIRN